MLPSAWPPIAIAITMAVFLGCAPSLSPEQKEQVKSLQGELSLLRMEIASAQADESRYAGGLIKSMIVIRLEVLKTNEALIQQRILAIEGWAKIETSVKAAVPDASRAASLAKEIEAQRRKLDDAKAESDRYAGGLVKALAETSVATTANTIAMLEQARLTAQYGLLAPQLPVGSVSPTAVQISKRETAQPQKQSDPASTCLKIESFDSSVLSSNGTFTEVAWKADVANSCSEVFNTKVVFKLYDKDEFELDSDSETLSIGPNSTGKARGKMLVHPPEKARRMARQGVHLSF
jgi:hypothetical protein